MITLTMEQGTQEWIEARLGIPTSSNFSRLITPGGAASKQAEGYMHKLIAERLLNASLDEYVSDWMERGNLLEDQARSYYELQRDLETTKVGFCTLDDSSAGCSPDCLVGDDGGLEIKCPAPHTHVGYMLDADATKYKPQVQGSLWVTGRQWWDWLSFHPDLPPVLQRFERDEEYIAKLSQIVLAFIERLDAAREYIDGHYLVTAA